MKTNLTIALLTFASGILFAADPPIFELRSVAEAPTSTTKPYSLPQRDGTAETLNLESDVLLDHMAVKSAAVSNDFQGKRVILIKLTDAGSKRFGEITKRYVSKRLGIVIAGKLLVAPVVMEPIYNGAVQMSGDFTEKEASDLAAKLNKKP